MGSKEVVVVFTEWTWSETPRNPIWRLIRLIGVWHVYVLINHGRLWTAVNSDTAGVNVQPIANEYVGTLVKADDVIHAVYTHTVDAGNKYGWFDVFSCVTLTKRILGIDKWWVITPKQLYKELMRGTVSRH